MKRRGGIVPLVIVLACAIIALVFAFGHNWAPPAPDDDNDFEAAVIDDERPYALLVNKKFRLNKNYVPENLVKVSVPFAPNVKGERRRMRAEAAVALEAMFEAAEAQGLGLVAVSGYRSYKTQSEIYKARLREAGYDHVSRYVAQPGASEHQTGLAMDVGQRGNPRLEEWFGDTQEGRWLQENAAQYGFILRYPKEGEDVTGYAYEPWHFRYVGEQMAREIQDRGTVLETYLEENR